MIKKKNYRVIFIYVTLGSLVKFKYIAKLVLIIIGKENIICASLVNASMQLVFKFNLEI